MRSNQKVTTTRLIAVLISSSIGVGLLALPRVVASTADTGAPLITLLGIICAYPLILLLAALGRRFPNQTIISYGQDILGKWLGSLATVCIVIFFAIFSALSAREFGEVVVTVILPRTPVEITVLIMLMLAMLSARRGIVKLAYVHTFYLPFILIPAFFIMAQSLPAVDILNLRPLIGNQPQHVFSGATYVTAMFAPCFIMTLLIPKMVKPEQATKAGSWALVISGIFYLFLMTMTIGIFGPHETKLLIWPTLEAARASSIPGAIFERLDGIFILVWVICVYTTLYSSYYLSLYATRELFKLQDHRHLATFFMPFIFVLALIPPNIVRLYQLINWVGKIGLLVTIGYPCLLLLVALARKKRGASDAT